MKKFFTKEVKIGLTGIIALIVLYLGIQFLKGASLFGVQDNYYIKFKNAKGLAKSSTVFADGYNIGIVSDISYDFNHPGQVVVEISVDPKVRIPRGTSAQLAEGMLGGCTLNMVMGKNPAQCYEVGDTIDGDDAGGLMDMAAGVVPDVQQMVQKVDTLLGTLNMLASNGSLAQILDNMAMMSENLNRTTMQLNTMMNAEVPALAHNLNGTVTDVRGQVVELTDNYSALATTLNKELTKLSSDLTRVTGNLNTLMGTANGKMSQLDVQPTLNSLNTAVNELQTTLNEVNKLTRNINSGEGSLGKLMNDNGLYDSLNTTVGSANQLLLDMKKHPGRYIHFSVFGKKDK